MTKLTKGTKIFISYSQANAPKLDHILKYLRSAGFINEGDQILKEEDLPSKHRSMREEVKRQIQSASKVFVVWSPSSANSQWVNYELGLADALGKEIIAVVPNDEKVPLPENLQEVQIVRVAAG